MDYFRVRFIVKDFFLCFTSAVSNKFYCTGDEPKNKFASAIHFFCTFLCRCFARLQRETLRNFLATRFMKEVSYICVPVHFFFFTTADSHFGGRQHFSFSHCRYKTFLRFPSNEIDLLCFLSLTLTLSLLYRSI